MLGSEAVYCDAAGPLVPARALPDAGLLARLRDGFPEAELRPIGTSARVGGSHGVEVEAMEGFAVLRACELAGVPAVEVRVVSNASTSRTGRSGASTRRSRCSPARCRGSSR